MLIDKIAFQQLDTGARPSAILGSINTDTQYFNDKLIACEFPSTNCICSCRGNIRIIGEAITACRLAKATEWNFFTDDASQRQI